jgi:predicted nucleic acid-binding protein
MKNKIYIETSVISYYVSERSENIRVAGHQLSTIDMWKQLDEFDVYISDIVVEESSKGSREQSDARLFALKNFHILERNKEILELTKTLLHKKAIPEKCPEDAAHIAIASFYNMDYIVTWNFKHINNPFMKKKIRKIIEESGYICPVLCSPEELIGEEHG